MRLWSAEGHELRLVKAVRVKDGRQQLIEPCVLNRMDAQRGANKPLAVARCRACGGPRQHTRAVARKPVAGRLIEVDSLDIGLRLRRGSCHVRHEEGDRGVLREVKDLTRGRADQANGHNSPMLKGATPPRDTVHGRLLTSSPCKAYHQQRLLRHHGRGVRSSNDDEAEISLRARPTPTTAEAAPQFAR